MLLVAASIFSLSISCSISLDKKAETYKHINNFNKVTMTCWLLLAISFSIYSYMDVVTNTYTKYETKAETFPIEYKLKCYDYRFSDTKCTQVAYRNPYKIDKSTPWKKIVD
jgi:hypothetical protein